MIQRPTYDNDLNEWLPLNGFIGFYEILSNGSIHSLDRTVNGWNGDKIKKGRLLKPFLRNGYLSVSLTMNGNKSFLTVHRLIAQTFIPNPFNKPTVNHINAIKTDNRIENLEWATHKEQIQHAKKWAC